MRSYARTDRVASLIKDELGGLIVNEVGDPRVHSCVITAVKVTADMSIARVYVRSLVSDEQGQARQELLKGLGKAAGFLRAQLGHRVRLQRTPTLEFFYDDTPDEAARVEAILAKLALEKKASDS
jgi:ribosome-binding factor A